MRLPPRLRALAARVFAREVPATYMPEAGSWRELQGHPGAYTTFARGDGRKGLDAACPGCGQHVAGLEALGPQDAPTTPLVVFSACCGWTGRLHRGVWSGV